MELGWSNFHIQIAFEVIILISQHSCLSSKLVAPLLDPLEPALALEREVVGPKVG